VTELLPLLIQQAAPAPSCAEAMLPILLMLVVFYFLLVRPQQKQEQQRQETLRRLSKGDEVITSGGLIGVIHAVKDHELLVKFDDNVTIRVSRDDVDPYAAPQASVESK